MPRERKAAAHVADLPTGTPVEIWFQDWGGSGYDLGDHFSDES